MFRPSSKTEKPPVVMPEKKEIAPEQILSPEEKEIKRIVKEFLDLAKNIDEIAKRDPQIGFEKIGYLKSEGANIMRLYGLDTNLRKKQMVADELLKIANTIPESEKYIITNEGKDRSSSLDIIARGFFGAH